MSLSSSRSSFFSLLFALFFLLSSLFFLAPQVLNMLWSGRTETGRSVRSGGELSADIVPLGSTLFPEETLQSSRFHIFTLLALFHTSSHFFRVFLIITFPPGLSLRIKGLYYCLSSKRRQETKREQKEKDQTILHVSCCMFVPSDLHSPGFGRRLSDIHQGSDEGALGM